MAQGGRFVGRVLISGATASMGVVLLVSPAAAA
jgi:hypothetical protein